MAGWAANWIDTAQDLVRHEFEFTYASRQMTDSDTESDGPADVASFVSPSTVRFIYFCYITDRSQQTQNSTNIFDNLPALTPTQGKAVIDEPEALSEH